MRFYTEYSKKYKRLVINLLGLKLKIKLAKIKPQLDCPNINGNYQIMRECIYKPEQRNNIKGRVLLVFPNNFVRNDAGNSSYVYNIVKVLKNLGYEIDFLGVPLAKNEFVDFEKYNIEGLVNTFYLYNGENNVKSRYQYYCNSWVTDGLLDYFNKIINSNVYSHIYIHYVQLLDLIRFSKLDDMTRVVHSIHDFAAFQSYYSSGDMGSFLKDLGQEVSMLNYADELLYISQDERAFFKRFLPQSSSHWLPHFGEGKSFPLKEKDIDCLFIGHSNNYNKNALIWFIDNVYKYLNSPIKIMVCGRVVNQIKQEASDYYEKMIALGFEIVDFAEDLDAIYARTKISIVPMLAGTGLKTKTVAAMSYGIPVVATELGVDGFWDKSESGCLVSDDPKEFADYINKLLTDEQFYQNVKNKIELYFDKYFTVKENTEVIKRVFSFK